MTTQNKAGFVSSAFLTGNNAGVHNQKNKPSINTQPQMMRMSNSGIDNIQSHGVSQPSSSMSAKTLQSKNDPLIRALIEAPTLDMVQEAAGGVQNSYKIESTLNPGSSMASKLATSNLLRGYGNRTSGVKMAMNGFASNAKQHSRLNTALYAVQDSTQSDEDKIQEYYDEKPKAKFTAYAWVVLAVTVLIRVMVQWQRSIFSYAYGYTGLGLQAANPIYEISTAYPGLSQYFGLLTGMAYTLPFAVFGLFVGKLTDTVNRKWALSAVIVLASTAMGLTGFCDSMLVLGLMRVFHGMINSSTNPLSFSLVSDYFPPDKRATANSIIHSGQYIGSAMGSISILLIKKFGWRSTYGIMGAVSMAVAGMIALLVREPERGRFLTVDEKEKQIQQKIEEEEKAAMEEASGTKENGVIAFFKNLAEVTKLPCTRNVLIAGFLRNFAGCIITYYLPVFFGKNHPSFKAQYAVVNAAILSICGIIASLISGIMADKLEKKSFWAKGAICVIGQSLAVPLICLATLQTSSFWLSIAAYTAYFLVASTYVGPAITMMQNTAPVKQQGNVVSAYFFCITIAQTISPAIFGMLCTKFGAVANPTVYGPLIAGFSVLGFIGSVPFWFRAGRHYKDHMTEKQRLENDDKNTYTI